MHSFRQQSGWRKISQPQLNGHRTQFTQSLPTLLINKYSEHPKAVKAIFVTILFLWVGLVALFSSKLPSDNHTNFTISPLSARQNQAQRLRALSSIHTKKAATKSHTKQKEQNELKMELMHHSSRDGIVALLLSKLPSSGRRPNDAVSLLSSIKNYQVKKPSLKKKKLNEVESIRQSTQNALDYSNSYAQKYVDVSPSVKSIYAFAAEDYLDTKTMMNDNDDSLDTYYALDDDAIRGKDYKEGFCSTPSFYRLYRPTCNEIHSTVSGYQWLTTGEQYMSKKHRSRYLGAGAYRQVFLLERQFASNSDEVIFKSMKRFSHNGKGQTLEERAAYNPEEVNKNFELYDDMRKDSMVMELLTSSPRIADIYSFCALSSIIEYAPGNIEDYVMPTEGYDSRSHQEKVEDPTPVNDYIKPVEKLEMALELAKGLAAMHGHSGGVIANVDVQIGQFCRGKDGLIKILDFNRAEVLLYDEEGGQYCMFENGIPPDGSLRAPEEIIDAPLTEKIDVYTLGNVVYSILTGLLVNRDASTSKAHWRITHGKIEEIDANYFISRSPAEMALVKVIQWCWTFDAKERPSIFQIVEFLEDEVRKNLYSSQDTVTSNHPH